MQKNILAVILTSALTLSVSGFAFGANIADIIKTGPGNSGTINQTGDWIAGYITQTSTPDSGAPGTPSGGNAATINQMGLHHYACVSQTALAYSGGHLATVDQSGGNGNWAHLEQYGHDVMPADVDQIGHSNLADIWSYRNGGTTDIYQKGDENQAYQSRDGANCNTLIEQVGNLNLATQDIGIGTPPRNSSFQACQYGNSNVAEQDMYGSSWGFAPSENHGTITQDGDGNYGFQQIEGGSAGNPDAVDNYAELIQTGSHNGSSQSQSGSGHRSTVTQTGDWNTSSVTQSN